MQVQRISLQNMRSRIYLLQRNELAHEHVQPAAQVQQLLVDAAALPLHRPPGAGSEPAPRVQAIGSSDVLGARRIVTAGRFTSRPATRHTDATMLMSSCCCLDRTLHQLG